MQYLPGKRLISQQMKGRGREEPRFALAIRGSFILGGGVATVTATTPER